MPTIGFAVGMLVQSPMLMMFPIMMFSMMAGNRKAFDARRVFGAPIAFAGMLWMMSLVLALFYQTPGTLIVVMGIIFFLGFYLIQKTGSPMGMLFIVAAALITVMGLGSHMAMSFMRSEMTKAGLCLAIFAPILYMLLPVKTREMNVEVHVPAPENGRVTRALIRTGIMLAYTLFLCTILDFSNMILAVGGMYILVFTTQSDVWREVVQRSLSTLIGGGAAMIILGALMLSGHLVVLLTLVFLLVLFLSDRMMTGRLRPMVYQDAASIMISIAGSALATSDPASAFMQRAGLTMVGALAAAVLVGILDALLVRDEPEPAQALPE